MDWLNLALGLSNPAHLSPQNRGQKARACPSSPNLNYYNSPDQEARGRERPPKARPFETLHPCPGVPCDWLMGESIH